jgi:hypothetical protein
MSSISNCYCIITMYSYCLPKLHSSILLYTKKFQCYRSQKDKNEFTKIFSSQLPAIKLIVSKPNMSVVEWRKYGFI